MIRDLTYKYLSLPYNVRLLIALSFHLIQDEDENDPDIFQTVIKRAKEMLVLEEFESVVNERFYEYDTGKYIMNMGAIKR